MKKSKLKLVVALFSITLAIGGVVTFSSFSETKRAPIIYELVPGGNPAVANDWFPTATPSGCGSGTATLCIAETVSTVSEAEIAAYFASNSAPNTHTFSATIDGQNVDFTKRAN